MARREMRLDALRRAVAADPSDAEAWHELLTTRARIEGSRVYLEVLRRRELWQQVPAVVQDLAIEEVKERLSGFEYLGAERFGRVNRRVEIVMERGEGGMRAQRRVVEEELCCRLGCFRHEGLGLEMVLLPGEGLLVPFLMAREPLVEGGLPRRMDFLEGRELLSFHGLRYPRLEEWEYAAAAGTSTRFYWGDEPELEDCWSLENSDGRLHSPAEHRALGCWNAFGLIDVYGNVWEWVEASMEQGGFLEEVRLKGGCSFRSRLGESPESGDRESGLRAVADVPEPSYDIPRVN